MKLLRFLCLLIVLLANSADAYSVIRYVRPTASGTGDGSSWSNASGNLSDMLALSMPDDSIWVAAGVYLPDRDINGNTSPANNRTKVFRIPSGVRLFGGFQGNEISFSQRNVAINITVLSGDLGIPLDSSDNCLHVVVFNNPTAVTILDGFQVKYGNAQGGGTFLSATHFQGSAVFIEKGGTNVRIANCTFSLNRNSTLYCGGNGSNSSPIITDCFFNNNRLVACIEADGQSGGQSGPTIRRCVFEANRNMSLVINTSSAGNSSATIEQCVFAFNTDCAIRINNASNNTVSLSISNSVFARNHSAVGTVIHSPGSSTSNITATFKNCTLWKNTTTSVTQEAVYSTNSRIYFQNCILWKTSQAGNGAILFQGFRSYLEDCLYQEQQTTYITEKSFCLKYYPVFVDTTDAGLAGADGLWRTADDGLHLQFSSPAFNSGNGSHLGSITTDIKGVSRISNGVVDIGAYEQQFPCNYTSVLYVDSAVATSGNGSSWSQAMNSLGDALRIAFYCNNVDTIKVARGTYLPNRRFYMQPDLTKPREHTFRVPSGLILLGGYDPLSGVRDPNTYTSLLSGNIGLPSDSLDNTYHIATVLKPTEHTLVDGFVFRNGEGVVQSGPIATLDSRVRGGAIYCIGGDTNLTISNCKFNKKVAFNGSSVFIRPSDTTMSMLDTECSPRIKDCIFEHNGASSGQSGDVYIYSFYNESHPIIANCIFKNNSACGAIYVDAYFTTSRYRVENCDFINNYSYGYGAGVYHRANDVNSSPLIQNCTFNHNGSIYPGGAIAFRFQDNVCNPEVRSCMFYDNYVYSTFNGGTAFHMEGLVSGMAKPRLYNCVFALNGTFSVLTSIAAPVFLLPSGSADGKVQLTNCTFYRNAGAAYGFNLADFRNSIIWGSSTNGPPHIWNTDTVKLSDCILQSGGMLSGVAIQNGFQGSTMPAFRNINLPLGLDWTGRTSDDGLILQTNSNALNVGNNTFVTGISVDILGHPRIIDSVVDLGAYEGDVCTFDFPAPSVSMLPVVNMYCTDTLSQPTANDACDGLILGTTTDPTTFPVAGTYQVTWNYSDSFGNTVSQTQTVISTCDLNVPQNTENTPILVYPNPADEYCNIRYQQDEYESLTLTITCITGHFMQKKIIQDGESISLGSMPAGIYILNFTNNKEQVLGRQILVVVH